VGAIFLSFMDLFKTLKPLVTFFVLNPKLVTQRSFAKLFRISRPALHIEKSQRSARSIERHRVMQQKANGSFGLLRANWANAFGKWMSAVIQSGGILDHQNHGLFAHALERRLIVRAKKLIHGDVGMIKKPIRGSSFGAALTGLRQVGLRAVAKSATPGPK